MLDDRFQKGGPIPPNLGSAADLYAEVRNLRLDMDKAVAEVKARETEIHDAILATLNESTDTGASGKFYRVQRVEKDRLQVKDWDATWAFIQQTGEFQMLQRRLADKAVNDWIEAKGSAPPGIEVVPVATLSFTKV